MQLSMGSKESWAYLKSEISALPYLKGIVEAFESSKSGSISQALSVYATLFPENEQTIRKFSDMAMQLTADILKENGAPSFAANIFKRNHGFSASQIAAEYADTAVKVAMLYDEHRRAALDRHTSPCMVKDILEEAFWKMCVGRAPWQLH